MLYQCLFLKELSLFNLDFSDIFQKKYIYDTTQF
jgi:hypothetical protein